MTLRTFSCTSAACLVIVTITPISVDAQDITPTSARPVLVAHSVPFDVPAPSPSVQVPLVSDEPRLANTGTHTPIEFANAVGAAAYLAFAVPSLLFTVPLQLLSGRRS